MARKMAAKRSAPARIAFGSPRLTAAMTARTAPRRSRIVPEIGRVYRRTAWYRSMRRRELPADRALPPQHRAGRQPHLRRACGSVKLSARQDLELAPSQHVAAYSTGDSHRVSRNPCSHSAALAHDHAARVQIAFDFAQHDDRPRKLEQSRKTRLLADFKHANIALALRLACHSVHVRCVLGATNLFLGHDRILQR